MSTITIGRKIHVTAFGWQTNRQLFRLTFEPWFPRNKYYSILSSLRNNPEFVSMFGEEVGSLTVEDEEKRKTERGFYEGMTVEICRKDSYSKLIDLKKLAESISHILPFKGNQKSA